MNKHPGLKVFLIVLSLLIIFPMLYLAYDRSNTLPPPPSNWVSSPYVQGQTWEQYVSAYLISNPQPNAASHYLNALSLMTVDYSGTKWNEANKVLQYGWNQNYPGADEILQSNQPALQEVLSCAEMKLCEFPPVPYSFNAPHPDFLRMQIMGKLIILMGKKLESQKKYTQAMECYLSGIQFGKDINPKNPTLIFLLISKAIIQMNTQPLLKLIAQDKLGESDYRQIIPELPTIEKEQATFQDGLDWSYRNAYLNQTKRLLDPFGVAKSMVTYSWATISPFTPKQKTTLDEIKDATDIGLYTGYIFLNQNRITKNLVDYYADVLSAATTKSYNEFMQINWESKFPKDWVNNWIGAVNLIGIYTREMIEVSKLRLAQIQAAIHLYHLKNKKWPDSLNDLEPDYITKVPLDPFVDKPFQWSQDSGVPFVYSVGPDFKDDSAKTYYDPTNGTVSGGDIRP